MKTEKMPHRSGSVIIHRGAWGDLYVSLAALAEVIELNRGEPVYVMGSRRWLEILKPRDWPVVKQIWLSESGQTVDVYGVNDSGDNWALQSKSVSARRLFLQVRASFNLRTESLRYGWAPLIARVPERMGTAPWPWRALFYTDPSQWLGKDPLIHERDRMLQVIEGKTRRGQLVKKWQTNGGLPSLKTLSRQKSESVSQLPFGSYWLVNPTCSRREKAWLPDRFGELISALKQPLAERGLDIVLIGTKSETDWLSEVAAHAQPSTRILQTNTIHDLVDVLYGAKLLITNTSSVQFLAPGVGLQTLTIMGCAQREIWGPLGPRDVVVQSPIHNWLRQQVASRAVDLFEAERQAYESIELSQVLNECLNLLNQ